MPRLTAAILALALCLPGQVAVAQDASRPLPPILLVDPRVVMEQSRTGQDLMELNRTERAAAQAEADALSASFEAEEQILAARRALLTREAFAELAADFDRRVRLARAEQDLRGQELLDRTAARERAFFEALTPIYREIVNEVGAAAILDLRNVILANSRLDVSQEVIRRLDQRRVDPVPEQD